jgi:TM2 domain-containing membrane protein YozV
VINPGTEPTPVVSSITEFKKMSVKDVEKMTGKKMNLIQKAGFKIAQKLAPKKTAGGKSQLVAALLCFFIGGLGIHRFYLGYTWQGIVQILTLGGLGIWVLIDFIRILIGTLGPKDGEYESTL